MASIRIRNRSSSGGIPGLTKGELAVNLADGVLWVGSTNDIPIYLSGVQTFNGLTGAVTGVTVGGANVFTQLNTFQAGISASGATLGRLVVNDGISAAGGITFSDRLWVSGGITAGSLTQLGSLNVTGIVTANDGLIVQGFNGATFETSVSISSGLSVSQRLNVEGIAQFTSGLSASGATLGRLIVNNGISAAGGITFNSLSHFTQGLSGSGATLGTLVVNSGISASGGVTFHNNVWVGGLLTANGGISAAGGVTFANTVHVGQTLSYNGNLVQNGEIVATILSVGTTSDLPRPPSLGVTTGSIRFVRGPVPTNDGIYFYNGLTWVKLSPAYNVNDLNGDGLVNATDLAYILAAWSGYGAEFSTAPGQSGPKFELGLQDLYNDSFEIKVYGASGGTNKKASILKITTDDAVPQIFMKAGTVQMDSDLMISPVGDYTTTISQVSGVIQTGFIHATGFTAGGRGSTFDGNLTVGNLLTLNGGLSAGGATFTAPVYMGATLTMNSNIRFNSGYGITGGFVDAGWY